MPAWLDEAPPKNPKEFWRAVKYLRKQQSTIPTLTDDSGTTTHTSLEENATRGVTSPLEFPDDFYYIAEVCDVLSHLDISKLNGPNGISANTLKYTAPYITSSII